MASSTHADRGEDELIFSWRLRRLRRWGLLFFLLVSISLHALGFYLIRVVYPRGARPPSRPVKVTLLVPGDPKVSQLLQQIAGRVPLFQGSLDEVRPQVTLQDHSSHFEPSFADWEPELGTWGTRRVASSLPLLNLPGQRSLPAFQLGTGEVLVPPEGASAPALLQTGRVFSGAEFIDRVPVDGLPLPAFEEIAAVEQAVVSFLVAVDATGRVRHCLPGDEIDSSVAAARRRQLMQLRLAATDRQGIQWGRLELRWFDSSGTDGEEL